MSKNLTSLHTGEYVNNNTNPKKNANYQSFDFFHRDDFQLYSRKVKHFCNSPHAAIYFNELMRKFHFYASENNFVSDKNFGKNWFPLSTEAVFEKTCLNIYQQKIAINKLLKLDLIEYALFGCPRKRHFKLNEEKILNVMGFSYVG